MVNAIHIALSGLLAQGRRLPASAENIVNISTTGSVPTEKNPESNGYKALEVNISSLSINGEGSGITTEVVKKDSYALTYDPSSTYANEEGYIASPDINLENELVTMMTAKLAYEANIKTIKTADEMMGELLDTIS